MQHNGDQLNRDWLADDGQFDALTGVYTNTTFLGMFGRFVEGLASGRIGGGWALVYLNIGNFKVYNNNYGYAAGDSLLKTVAGIIRDAAQTELVARISGDRFCFVVQEDRAEDTIRSIHDTLRDNGTQSAHIYAGIYSLTGTSENGRHAIDRAKLACDRVRDDYNDYYCRFTPEMEKNLQIASYLISHVDEALKKGWVRVYYQPVVDTLTGKILAAEALSRWIDPVYGFLSPDQFISTLEHARILYKVDLFVLEQVCRIIASELEAGRDSCQYSINLSRHDLELPDLHERIDAITRKYYVPHELLHFEITESALISNEGIVQEYLQQFHQEGYEVWLDDFGSGYSSLNTIQNYDFDCIKMDMLFLRKRNARTPFMMQSIVDMSKHIGMNTLAEGVETQEDFDLLRAIGCNLAQGYLFSKPRPYEELVSDEAIQKRGVMPVRDRAFYHAIGRVNILNWTNPADSDAHEELPLFLYELDPEREKVLYANDACVRFFTEMVGRPWQEILQEGNLRKVFLWKTVLELSDKAEHTGKTAAYDFIWKEVSGRLVVSFIVKSGKRRAFLARMVRIENVRDTAEFRRQSAKDIFSLFDGIDEIYPDRGRMVHLYGELQDYGNPEELGLAEVVRRYAAESVSPTEQESYIRFLDVPTLSSRIRETPNGAINGFFHLKASDGSYKWKRIVITAMHDEEGQEYFLLCICRNVAGWDSFHMQELLEQVGIPSDIYTDRHLDVGIRKDALWSALTHQEKLGIFWKDKDRRFIGANEAFLYYYGMTLSDIVGKNDEDMGWHPDPIPFKKDEESVLREGKIITNAVGACVVEGEVRKILAFKAPVYRRGKIVGLVGYFVDISNVAQLVDVYDREQDHDLLTGLLNENGMRDALLHRERLYQAEQLDFGFICVQILGLAPVRNIWGRDKYAALLEKIGILLQQTAGIQAMVGRAMSGRFEIAVPCASRDEVEQLRLRVEEMLSAIRSIDEQTPFTCYFATGEAVYSDYLDIQEMITAAGQRMRTPGGTDTAAD